MLKKNQSFLDTEYIYKIIHNNMIRKTLVQGFNHNCYGMKWKRKDFCKRRRKKDKIIKQVSNANYAQTGKGDYASNKCWLKAY